MDASTRREIIHRAQWRCEYCLIPQDAVPFITFHVDHVIAQQHQLNDDNSNLAYSCHRCNAYKGPNLASVDPESNAVVLLFHPRKDNWADHFQLHAAEIIGLTPTGRAISIDLDFANSG